MVSPGHGAGRALPRLGQTGRKVPGPGSLITSGTAIWYPPFLLDTSSWAPGSGPWSPTCDRRPRLPVSQRAAAPDSHGLRAKGLSPLYSSLWLRGSDLRKEIRTVFIIPDSWRSAYKVLTQASTPPPTPLTSSAVPMEVTKTSWTWARFFFLTRGGLYLNFKHIDSWIEPLPINTHALHFTPP